ncbi:hypothetical protein D3C76_1185300 [compost metagenome]
MPAADQRQAQLQFVIGPYQHGQLGDYHQAILGGITQLADFLTGKTVEYLEDARQLMAFDVALVEHDRECIPYLMPGIQGTGGCCNS